MRLDWTGRHWTLGPDGRGRGEIGTSTGLLLSGSLAGSSPEIRLLQWDRRRLMIREYWRDFTLTGNLPSRINRVRDFLE